MAEQPASMFNGPAGGDNDTLAGLSAKERRMAQRRCIAEDKEWNLALVEKLSELCLRVVVANFEKSPKLNGIPSKHRERVLSSISINLPLTIAAPLIPDESYWKRRAAAHFKNCDPSLSNNTLAVGNGVGGFGGGLMGVTPLVSLDKAALTMKTPKLGSPEYSVGSLEDIWMGFGNPPATETAIASAADAVDAMKPDSASGGGLDVPGLGFAVSSNSRRASTVGMGTPEKPTSKGSDKSSKYTPMPASTSGKWKSIFFEHHIQNLVESFCPKKIGLEQLQELQKELRLAAPFLTRLDLRQLKPTEPMEGEVVKATDPPPDHLDIGLVLGELVYLKYMKLYYGVRDCGMNFSWKLFGMTLTDCGFLATALKCTMNLETLVIQASNIDNDRARLISSALLENKTVQKLDLSHNKIGCAGARGVAKVLASSNCLLTHLDISNNHIKQGGAHSLGKALQVNSSLIHLNLRMNRLGDDGGADFCACLTKVVSLSTAIKPPATGMDGNLSKGAAHHVASVLCSLDMASNGLGMDTVQALCVLLKKGGRNLRYLDFSCNKLGEVNPKTNMNGPGFKMNGAGRTQPAGKNDNEVAGKLLFEAVSQNKYITHFDLRVTDLSMEHLIAIKGIIAENSQQ
ncbi:hypothetical protein BJ741DRAFT_589591 [Chytriomyces cf. hyalinus JEL632]|nr:hypothetical protein BJ741DRAFT_589591 [Chytriomyces cf. hyalinus JEL632]